MSDAKYRVDACIGLLYALLGEEGLSSDELEDIRLQLIDLADLINMAEE
jgi:hypothetical protein